MHLRYRCSSSVQPQAANENAPTKSAGASRCGLLVPDDDLLSHGQSTLSSACCRFTVLFGMGRGGSGGLWSSGVEETEEVMGCAIVGLMSEPSSRDDASSIGKQPNAWHGSRP